MPTMSSRRPRAPLDSGRKRSTATSARAMTGRLTTNTEPHQKCWSSTPATMGPSGRPTIVEMPSTAMARLRSSTAKSTTTDDMASGMRTAAPTPSSVRAAMRLVAVVDSDTTASRRRRPPDPPPSRACGRSCLRAGRPGAAAHPARAGSCRRTTRSCAWKPGGPGRCRAAPRSGWSCRGRRRGSSSRWPRAPTTAATRVGRDGQ